MRSPKIIVEGELGDRCDFAGITAGLLESIPPGVAAGLDFIVFREAGSLPRRDRRSSTRSQGRKVFLRSSLGFYQPAGGREPAYIEIYADNLLRQIPSRFRGVRTVQELTLAHVLFHEVGHHIHRTQRPRHADVEQEAEHWRRHLGGVAFDAPYWARRRGSMPLLFLAAASPGLAGLWGVEFIERHYRWALLCLPILLPVALYSLLRRLVAAGWRRHQPR